MDSGSRPKAWSGIGDATPPVSAPPPEPGAGFIAHLLEATRQLLPLPAWFARYPAILPSLSARQALWARGRRLSANEDVGFALAERMQLEAIGSLWRLFQAAPSLRALDESYAGWHSLLFDYMEPFRAEEGDRIRLCGRAPPGIVVDRGEQDFRAAFIIRMWRVLHGRADLAPLAMSFTYPRPRSVRRHQSVLGTHELSFSQSTWEMVISRQLFDAPLPGADAQEFARLHAAACQAVRMQQAHSVTAQADATVTWLLAAPGASAQAVARKLGVSVRTLRRRLAEEGGSFRALIDGVRQREAQLFLETGLYTMKQLALRVGFANDRALRHALRRWKTRQSEP